MLIKMHTMSNKLNFATYDTCANKDCDTIYTACYQRQSRDYIPALLMSECQVSGTAVVVPGTIQRNKPPSEPVV